MPKSGQKLTDNPKGNIVQVRMDDKTVKVLDFLASNGKTRSTVIREGIWLQYERDQKARERRNGTRGMLINGLEEARDLLRDPAVYHERFGVFFNDIMDRVVLEESPSWSDIQQFERDGLLYCGDIQGSDNVSVYDIREIIEGAIAKKD